MATGHGLQRHQAEGLIPAGQQQDIALRKQPFNVILLAQELDVGADSQLVRQTLRPALLRTVARHPEFDVVILADLG